jgi:hypothetical protein
VIRVAISLILLAQEPVPKVTVTYLPSGVLSTDPRYDDSLVRGHSQVLIDLREPSLFAPVNPEDVGQYAFRFTYLRAFNEPIVVRLVVLKDGTGELHAKRGPPVTSNNQQIVDQTLTMSKDQTAALLSKIQASGFWTEDPKETSVGLDGSDWIFEGRKDGDYHVVRRWEPRKGKLRELGLQFLKVSNLKLSGREIY